MLGTLSIAAFLGIGIGIGPPVQRPVPSPPPEPASLAASLEWEAPPECPGPDPVLEQIEALAPGLAAHPGAAVSVRLEPRPDQAGYAVELHLQDRHGILRRRLEAADCGEAQRATALLIAVLIDPVASAQSLRSPAPDPKPETRDPETQTPETQTPEEAPTPGPVAPPALADAPEIEIPPRWRSTPGQGAAEAGSARAGPSLGVALGIFGGGGYGPTNTGTATIGGSLALLSPHPRAQPGPQGWRAELDGSWTLPRTLRPSPALGGTFDAWFVAARGCYVPAVGARGRVELPLCAGVEFGRVRGRGTDELPEPLDASLTWFALGLGQGLRVAVRERLALGLELQLSVPLLGGRFLIETHEIQRVAPVSARALAGIELRLP